jgi:PAS domain S-box-containing protein
MPELNRTSNTGQAISPLEQKISSGPQTRSLPPRKVAALALADVADAADAANVLSPSNGYSTQKPIVKRLTSTYPSAQANGAEMAGQVWPAHSPEVSWDHDLPSAEPIRVLLIEDDQDDAFILCQALADVHNYYFEVTHSLLLMEGLVQLARSTYDVILLDMVLPDSLGIESLQTVRARAPRAPVIVLSGLDDAEFAFKAVKLGAQDYLVKGKSSPELIAKTIQYSIERQQIKEAYRTSEERFRNAFDYAAIGMGLVSDDGRWLRVNHSLCEILGFSEAELLSQTFQSSIHPDDLYAHLDNVLKLLAGKIRYYQVENRYFHRLGHTMWILLSVSLVRDSQGQPLQFIFQIGDITRRKQAEEALQGATIHAQQHAQHVSDRDADRTRLINGRYEAPLQAIIRCGRVVEQASLRTKKGSNPLDEHDLANLNKTLSETAAQIKSILSN